MKRLVFCLFAILFLVGCGKKITEGEVYSKEYEPERTIFMLYPMIISNGKTTTTMMIPMYLYDDEDFIVQIKNYDGKKEKTRTLYLTKEVYDKTNIGDWFVIGEYPKQVAFSDPDVKRRATKEEQEKL